MLTERNVWLAATTAVVCILLLMLFQPPTGRRERPPLYVTDLGIIVSTDGGQTWRVAFR